ncbi:MAG TPA: glycosyltransferase [Gemmatimonadaceae bacterium]|nr:glycosyltransferase [Gemmatimonadaceae bacterium]
MTTPLTTPVCSVVMPAHGAGRYLPETLGALVASDLPRESWELIVVDDGSLDETAAVAGRFADTVIRLPGRPHGPAYARNRGFEVARGPVVVFFDADVVVHRDTLRRLLDALAANPDAGAIFGAYDTTPRAPGLVSQYRNLIHHYVHMRGAGEVDTFWAGAGAVRRDVFEEAGMYDEWHYARPQIEDIELGARIRALGKRILLMPHIQVTHLKKWSLGNVVRTDLRDRGIPWARLLAQRGAALSAKSLNLRWTERLFTALVWLASLLIILAVITTTPWLIALAVVLVIPVIALNWSLWSYMARLRGIFFAIAIIPLHLMYYALNGISFLLGLLLQQTVGAPVPDPTTAAYAEVGVQRWPPIPRRHRRSTWVESDD